MNPLYRRRRYLNKVALTFATLSTVMALALLFSILGILLWKGLPAFSWTLFTQSTPAPQSPGGLANALFGSLALSLLAIALALPLGLLAGIYLAEYGRFTKLSIPIRFVNDILLSAPSICIGMFVFEIMVQPMHHFSGLAGIVALAIIATPIIVRTSEDMLGLVPDSLREAASALGAPRWHVICHICVQSAKNGLITGVMLALARIAGETAPLLFTSLNNQFWSTNLNAPLANLPVTIFQFAMSPYGNWQQLAWAGALLITFTVLILNIAARLLTATAKKERL